MFDFSELDRYSEAILRIAEEEMPRETKKFL